jgi:hypothetical protein
MHRLYSAHREIWDHVRHTKYQLWSLQGIDLQGSAHFLTERTTWPVHDVLSVMSVYRTFLAPHGSPKMHRLYSAHREIWDHVRHTKYQLWSLQGIDLQGNAHFLTERTRTSVRFLLHVTGPRQSVQLIRLCMEHVLCETGQLLNVWHHKKRVFPNGFSRQAKEKDANKHAGG